jgi:hypothetical protein
VSKPHDIKGIIALAERKARKVEAFIKMLRDPDLAEFVASLTAINSNGSGATISGRLEKQNPQSGIREAIRSLDEVLPARFTGVDILKELEQRKFPFQRDGLNAVRDALYKMTRRGELKVLKVGKGGQPNVYERRKP